MKELLKIKRGQVPVKLPTDYFSELVSTFESPEEILQLLSTRAVKVERIIEGVYQAITDPQLFLSTPELYQQEKFIVKNVYALFPDLLNFCQKTGLEQDLFLSAIMMFDFSPLKEGSYVSPSHNSFYLDLVGGSRWVIPIKDRNYVRDFSKFQTANSKLKHESNLELTTLETQKGECVYIPSGLANNHTRQTPAPAVQLVLFECFASYSELIDHLSTLYFSSEDPYAFLSEEEALKRYGEVSLSPQKLFQQSESFIAQRKMLKFKFGNI